MVFFSVVVPVYNKEKYLARSISSVLSQTCSDFELLAVCDPSSDGSNQIVEAVDDARVRIIYRDQPGPGGYAARNLGVKEARGEWVTFLDADDEWKPDHLENLCLAIERNPDIHVITCAREIREGGSARLDKFSSQCSEKERVLSFFDYLRIACKYEHLFHPNSIALRKAEATDFLWFPEGKVKRSGDLYAWVVLACKVERFLWSSHVGSVLYKDVVGVSKTSLPSISINHEMVEELKPFCSENELLMLKRYANHLIRVAWFENREAGVSLRRIGSYFFNGVGFWYCLKWRAVSAFPVKSFGYLRSIRRAIRRLGV